MTENNVMIQLVVVPSPQGKLSWIQRKEEINVLTAPNIDVKKVVLEEKCSKSATCERNNVQVKIQFLRTNNICVCNIFKWTWIKLTCSIVQLPTVTLPKGEKAAYSKDSGEKGQKKNKEKKME